MTNMIHVLLVDDDEDEYVIMQEFLADESGFVVHWTDSYDDALTSMCRSEYDVYLVDYRLGAYNGLDLSYQAMLCGCHSPIILITGMGDQTVSAQAFETGVANYLHKDAMDKNQLINTIIATLEQHR